MNNEPNEPGRTNPKGRWDLKPGVGEPMWVKCGGFRTMAYRDEDGTWRLFSNGKKLEGQVEVIERE